MKCRKSIARYHHPLLIAYPILTHFMLNTDIMADSKKTVSAAARSQTFTAVNKACNTYGIDAKQLMPVYGRKLDDVPAELKKAWMMAHRIARNYAEANLKAARTEAAMASAAL